MSKIDTKRIIRVQSAMSGRFTNREDRLVFLSEFFGKEISTTKELTVFEADDLLHYLNTGEATQSNWASFNKHTEIYPQERKLLWSYLYQAQWVVPHTKHNEVPDTKRLSNFLKSNRSPVNKPLKELTKAEWEKILHAFRQIVKFQHR